METETRRRGFEVILTDGQKYDLIASSFYVDRSGALIFEDQTFGIVKGWGAFLSPVPHWKKKIVSFANGQWGMVRETYPAEAAANG